MYRHLMYGFATAAAACTAAGMAERFSFFQELPIIELTQPEDGQGAEELDELAESGDPPPPATWLSGWKGGVSLGLNGSEGNTDRLSLRAGVNGQRVVERYDTRFGLTYVYSAEDGSKTEHRFRGDLRNDWLFQDSPWRIFAQGAVDIDEFQNWDWRLQGFGGVGYAFIREERTELIGRAGLGASRAFGGDDNDVRFEAILGVDFARQITDRQKFTFTGEVYPSLSDGGEFRALLRAGYEILVDPESGLSLKLGVEDRYDSDPGGDTKKNDLDYFVLLVWSF
ncbi:MAG: DUF481 domain-containing protein [Phycisphaeraceae bacterium]|nr:DUF481 domain-containing protein [Phycisphaeraceae bacterium]MCW5753524.1 DUF481 domain-containing protein [Phycisphaeraceae bacterium]